MGLSGFNYSRQAQPGGCSSQWWSLPGKKIISQQHYTLCLRKEASQKRNNLLEFLWFGKISCTCSQLLEESWNEISRACLHRAIARPLLHLQGWMEAPLCSEKAHHLCPSTVSSKTWLCSDTLSRVWFSPSHPGQKKVRVAC